MEGSLLWDVFYMVTPAIAAVRRDNQDSEESIDHLNTVFRLIPKRYLSGAHKKIKGVSDYKTGSKYKRNN